MFKKILIANRGEIACRIIKTAQRLGIACVAVYSEADRSAPFVAMADEAIAIGAAAAAQSYLAIERIIAACRASGAEAVHPGYGFLSENAAFTEAVEAAGLTFIGPNRRAIAAMGDKIAAKGLARSAGVSILPGYAGAIADEAQARVVAAEIGYPIMLKPAAGGGGKGMRIIRDANDMERGFSGARSEASGAFGDDRIFIEKFIEHPRHIEIQILGDKFGDLVHLGERECSIQRRHQKLIEEAPSPFVDAALRAEMAAQALALARAVDYDSAGTVEFLVDPTSGEFYFLEMNTRLQVEHPVTELVTGFDIVEEMLRSAVGERLTFTQEDVRLDGWAIEARICAEDTSRGFLPSSGRLVRFQPPREEVRDGGTLRYDGGVAEGNEISIHYDPMIGKLIAHGRDRAEATARLADGLDQFVIDGISHNIPFLSAILRNEPFAEGALSTDFVAEYYPHGFVAREASAEERQQLAIVAASIDAVVRRRVSQASVGLGETRAVLFGDERVDVVVNGGNEKEQEICVQIAGTGRNYLCQSDWHPGMRLWTGSIDGELIFVQVRPYLHRFELTWRGIRVDVAVLTPRQAELAMYMPIKRAVTASKILLCPMPGLLKEVLVSAGQKVSADAALCVIEAMKMENVLRTDSDAVIKDVFVRAGSALSIDQPILEFE